MRIPTLSELLALYAARGWVVHPEPRLNLLILRRLPGTLDAFDDMLFAWRGSEVLAMRCTADPGKPSREQPSRRDGTAVWAAGQVVDGLVVGSHHDSYACLVPRVPIPVLRYTSVDDPEGMPSTSTSVQIHRANATRESTVVGPWSEGCCVVANPDDFARLMAAARAQVDAGYKRFSVALAEWDGRGVLS